LCSEHVDNLIKGPLTAAGHFRAMGNQNINLAWKKLVMVELASEKVQLQAAHLHD
jgi:hypothetical protein